VLPGPGCQSARCLPCLLRWVWPPGVADLAPEFPLVAGAGLGRGVGPGRLRHNHRAAVQCRPRFLLQTARSSEERSARCYRSARAGRRASTEALPLMSATALAGRPSSGGDWRFGAGFVRLLLTHACVFVGLASDAFLAWQLRLPGLPWRPGRQQATRLLDVIVSACCFARRFTLPLPHITDRRAVEHRRIDSLRRPGLPRSSVGRSAVPRASWNGEQLGSPGHGTRARRLALSERNPPPLPCHETIKGRSGPSSCLQPLAAIGCYVLARPGAGASKTRGGLKLRSSGLTLGQGSPLELEVLPPTPAPLQVRRTAEQPIMASCLIRCIDRPMLSAFVFCLMISSRSRIEIAR